MHTHLKTFISSYSQHFGEYGRSYCERWGSVFYQVMHDTLRRKNSTVYILGNGGSHAIARCMRHALLAKADQDHSQCRVVTNVDPDSYSLMKQTPGPAYAEMLRIDGACTNDLIILISGSGNSDNLIEVASAATRDNIPLIALVGADDCALKSMVSSDNFFSVGISDQQIGEDIIQYMACLIGAGGIPPEGMADAFSHQSERIKDLPCELVLRVADSVNRSFVKRERVRVLGLGHPTMAACAEHTAHNFNWDAFYEISSEPDVTIISSPSACDYSGISNDRRKNYLRHFSKIYGSGDNSTNLIYALTGSDPRILELGVGIHESPMDTFVLCSSFPPQKLSNSNCYCSQTKDPFNHASLVQCIGHIIGRVLRLRLLQDQSTTGLTTLSHQPIDVFLSEGDLAQRRLIDES